MPWCVDERRSVVTTHPERWLVEIVNFTDSSSGPIVIRRGLQFAPPGERCDVVGRAKRERLDRQRW